MAVPDLPLHRAAPTGSVSIRAAGPTVGARPTGGQRAVEVGNGWVQVDTAMPVTRSPGAHGQEGRQSAAVGRRPARAGGGS